MWQAYYRKDRLRLTRDLVTTLREQYQCSYANAFRIAFRFGRAASVFATGNSISIDQANFLYLDFGDKPGVGHPTDVGSYPPSAFGLCDMHGNVCELVSDVWHDTFANAPTDGSSWNQPAESPWRVVRGGGWDGLPRVLRSAFRDWVRRDQRMDNMGFRIACDV